MIVFISPCKGRRNSTGHDPEFLRDFDLVRRIPAVGSTGVWRNTNHGIIQSTGLAAGKTKQSINNTIKM